MNSLVRSPEGPRGLSRGIWLSTAESDAKQTMATGETEADIFAQSVGRPLWRLPFVLVLFLEALETRDQDSTSRHWLVSVGHFLTEIGDRKWLQRLTTFALQGKSLTH
jgi:hypothetical protein